MQIHILLFHTAIILALVQNTTGATWYVATNGNDMAAGTNWSSAKATIQAAIDVAPDGANILVSNGVYTTGGRRVNGVITNRVAINKSIYIRSVNGPAVTIISGNRSEGYDAVRCAYVGPGAILSGFMLTNGACLSGCQGDNNDSSGGGAWCADSGILTNCIVTGNTTFGDGCTSGLGWGYGGGFMAG